MSVLTETFRDVLSQTFDLAVDGYWYPSEPGLPLVRVITTKDSYCVERRRRASDHWMPIAAVEVREFDPVAWRQWRSSWQMVTRG